MDNRKFENVRQLIEYGGSQWPDDVYLVYREKEFTFKEIDQRVNQVALGLSGLGLKKGGRVAVLIKNCPEFLYVWWAILKLGAVLVPVNLRLTAGEVIYIINHCEAQIMILGDQSASMENELRQQCPRVSNWLQVGTEAIDNTVESFYLLPQDLPAVNIRADDDAVILYTSGTTGFPKGVVHRHRSYLMTAAGFALTCDLKRSDRLLTTNPLFHVSAQFYSCLGTLIAGATFVLGEKFSASRLWSQIRKYKVNKAVMLLALTTILYKRPPQVDDKDNPLELVIAGGAPPGRYHDFEIRFGLKLQTLYSLTEGPLAIMSPFDQHCVEGAVGLAMCSATPGMVNQVDVFDQDGRSLPPGENGEIVIQNPAVMKEYLNNPEATQQTVKNGWLYTGDRGKKDDRGWIYYLGRAKDVIRKKGENISAAEVEAVLNLHDMVSDVAAIGVMPSDAAGEEEVLALVVKAPHFRADDKTLWEELITHCEVRLADFKVPRFWQEIDSLPKNATNRTVKTKLSQFGEPQQLKNAFDRTRKSNI